MAITARTKPSPKQMQHYRKRTGDHQRRSKEFHKAYWPYLPLLGVAGLVMIALGAWTMGPTGAVVGSVTAGIAAFTILL